jgi:hypothetical protein
MNNATRIAVIVRGKVIDTHTCQSLVEAERYKAAVRRWGLESGVMVGLITTTDRHWLMPAQAC